MAGIYTIGSKLGYDLANGMQVGQTIRATDGSLWTKNLDGSITVQHGGETLTGQITYKPTEADSGKMTNNAKEPAAKRQQQAATMAGGSGYNSPYADDLKQVIAGLQDSKWEGWNKDEDPAYQAYRKEYLREADRTMQDTLAGYAQNTGGIAGTSAIAAASQAADYHKSKLAAAIPTLHDNAYGRYLDGVAQQHNMANLLLNADAQADSQHYQNISYALNKWAQMGYADQEVASILGVAAGTPTSDQSYSDWSTAFNEQQYNTQQEAKAKAEADAKLQETLNAITVKPGKTGTSGPYDGTSEYELSAGEEAKAKEAAEYAMQWLTVNGRGGGADELLASNLKRKGYSKAVINYALVQVGL